MTTTAPLGAGAVPPGVLRAREVAIEESGVAERFHFFQLRNPAFWVYVWAMIAGLAHAFLFYDPGLGNYGGALIAGVVAFGIYGMLWLLFLHWLDRFAPLRASLLLVGFLWGAIAATTFIALTVNNAVLSFYGKTFGISWTNAWGAGFTAPFTEETAKAIGFILLLGLAPRLLNSAFDGFVAGAFIGLGFELAEDVLYVFNGAGGDFGANQVTHSLQVTALRMGSGLVSHALFTGLVCAGIMWILGRDPRGRHVLKGLLLILLAMLNHFVWDNAGAIGNTLIGSAGFAVVTPVAVVLGIVIALVVGLDAAGSERAWAAAILEPEVAGGVLTQAEADAVSGTHRHRKRFIKSAHGRSRKATKHVLAAGQELAVAIGRAGGAETPEVQHARAEVARVRGS